MRFLSVCSGIEAASVAWEPLGWHALAFSEVDPFASAVLAERFPRIANLGDLTRHEDWNIKIGEADILVGGTPCQSFSVAGMRRGFDDPRGQLTIVYLRLARRLLPEWIVWENVTGVLSSDGGRAFGAFLGALAELGYGFAYRVLDAQYFGVPQRRRRVFLVARRAGDWRSCAEVLLEPAGMSRDRPTREGAEEEAPSAAGAAPPCAGGISQLTDTVGALCAVDGKGAGNQYVCQNKLVIAPIQDGRAITKRQNGMGVAEPGSPSYTVDTTGAQAIAIQGNLIGRDKGGPCGVGASAAGTMYTLTRQDRHGVAVGAVVRRLTPLECERLQGFPDGWTDITFRGRPAPDGHRYKVLGNSMAVPCMRWIGERIAAADARRSSSGDMREA